jgi:hypothetical protein
MNDKPIHEIKSGGLKAALWLNERSGKSAHTVRVIRTFKTGDTWRTTSSFYKSDLQKLIRALSQAEQRIAPREQSAQ